MCDRGSSGRGTDGSHPAVRPASEGTDGSGRRPFVSVVIPVYEDPEGLAATLRSLADQTYPDDRHEVVVVDNGSSDRTPGVARRFEREHGTIRTAVETTPGSYAARNTGVEVTTGSVVSFVDADMTVAPDWLASVVDRLEASDAFYLACDVELPAPESGESLAARYSRRTAFPIEQYVTAESFAPTCCLTVRRRVAEDVGRFDDALISGGDREFGNRVAAAGYELTYAPDVSMTHPVRDSLRALVSKAVRIGRGSYQLRERYPTRYGHPLGLLVNPLTYTPPTPRSLRRHVDGWAELPVVERVSFFLFAWLLTLCRAYGKLAQALAGGVEGGADGVERETVAFRRRRESPVADED